MVEKIIITVAAMSAISGTLAILLVIAERFLANYGEVKISINEDAKKLVLQGGTSLLSALSSQKIFLPSACGGRGTCAYCKCKILSGAGTLLPTEAPLLTPFEIKNNIRLACQVKVKQDLNIEIPEELFNIKEFDSEVAFIQDLTYDIKLVRFQLMNPTEINFKAGQYVQLQNNPYEKVKERASRAYSIASPNYEKNYVDLMIRLVPEGIVTTWVHKHLKEKDRVKLVGPMGDFHLREGDGEIICVAGGSGMAPIVALLAEIASKKIPRKVVYFFGAVTEKDLFYLPEMEEFKKQIADFTFIPALSGANIGDEWKGERGLITVPLANYLQGKENSKTQAYMCGSPGMIKACSIVLQKYGLSEDRIFYDPFS
ncbi:2Fe-2S iron-sulfur cluster binding domain-containing protein [candidate division KSB1 bacterium]|nr:2Fe-2S iron-sulfur cluster binding domain-containing protein [candidate division KSB1 bacterium]